MKHTEEEYLRHDYFPIEEGVEAVISRRIVKTRTQHVCVPPTGSKTHRFQGGRVALREVAIVDGAICTCYICERHLNAYIRDWC